MDAVSDVPVRTSPAGPGTRPADGLLTGADGRRRCFWHGGHDDYLRYHDHEWGRPVVDDHRLFEKICLEGFQAGLSWLTILRKRENFRAAFAGFDPALVAAFGERDIERLLADAGIVRHRAKIEAAINNARRAQALIGEAGSLAGYLWRFRPQASEAGASADHAAVMARTTIAEAKALAADLKARGWRFVGPTTAYAFMQACGMVNDHIEGCWVREDVAAAQSAFVVPR